MCIRDRFVPSIFNPRNERKRQEQQDDSTDNKQRTQHTATEKHVNDAYGDEEADGVVYSGLIDFDVNDPHEIDRQRRIEAQLTAETTARHQQQRQQPQPTEEEEEVEEEEEDTQSTAVSSKRVREAINRYKRSGLATEEVDEKKEAELTSYMRPVPPVLEPTMDVRRWLERLERKIDALANQQQQPTVLNGSGKAERSMKRKATQQPAADIFAPIEQQRPQQQPVDDDESGPHKPSTTGAVRPQHTTQPAARAHQRRTDTDSKYADDEQSQPPPPPPTDPACFQSSVAQPRLASVIPPHSASSYSHQRPDAGGRADGDGGSGGGGLTLQQCFARRMGHVIASDEQRRQARQQRHHLAHAHCSADDDYDYHTAARHHTTQPSHSQSAVLSVNPASRRRRFGASVHSTAASVAPSVGVSSSHRRMQLGERGVIGEREARARSARVWRQLPEVRRRREEQRKREERRRSVERRQSYDQERRACQHSSHSHHEQRYGAGGGKKRGSHVEG